MAIDRQTKDAIEDAVSNAFSAGVESKRYIDVSRVPLICQSIINISADIKDINDKLEKNFITKTEFMPVRTVVYGFMGLVLTVVVLALLGLVIMNFSPAIKI